MKLFGTQRLQSLLGVTIIALMLGCSKGSDIRQVSGDVKTRLPVAEEGGEYDLKEVVLQGVSSLYEFAGTYANFYIYPSVSGTKITGFAPKTKFLKSGDLWVPQDTMTQQMAVIYMHMEKLAALDVQMGAEGVNTWPRDVGVSVRYRDPSGQSVVNNAFYDGQTDAMLVVPYTDDNLPIPVNAGILAHEHFHSLYFKLVEKQVFKERLAIHGEGLREQILGTSKKIVVSKISAGTTSYSRGFSRGINEGLADFWAWIYTGDADFLAASLPSEKVARSLNVEKEPTSFMSASLYNFRMTNAMSRGDVGESCLGMRVAYCLGTDYARVLKYLSGLVKETRGIPAQEARQLVGKAVIKSLPLLREKLLSLSEDQMFEPAEFFNFIQASLPDIQDKEKDFLSTLVKNSVKQDLVPSTAPRILAAPAARGVR